jgi:hypothetical protein
LTEMKYLTLMKGNETNVENYSCSFFMIFFLNHFITVFVG